MVTTKNLHKIIGLAFGLFLFILSLTGFFLDHDEYDFQWEITIDSNYLPRSVIDKQYRIFEAYKINPSDNSHILIGSRRGFFVSVDGGKTFKKTLNAQILDIEPLRNNFTEQYDTLFVSTTNGIYISYNKGFSWEPLALQSKLVNALSVWNQFVYAVIDKSEIYKIDYTKNHINKLKTNAIGRKNSPNEITLSRLIRDLHYGRGLFDGKLSLYINDFATIILIFLIITGFWFYITFKKLKKRKKVNKKPLKFFILQHSSSIVLITFIPIVILLITGIFLDHNTFFNPFIRKTKLNTKYLPPVYKSLKSDIWGIDYDGEYLRIGNRLGVFKSRNLQDWELESIGFAYRMKRINNELYICGMGSPNRVLRKNKWFTLKNTPHMPRDVYKYNNQIHYFSFRNRETFVLPTFDDVPLALILLALHDGDFFHPLWVYINDLTSIAVIILFITGFIRWKQSRRHKMIKLIYNKIRMYFKF